MFHHFDLHPTLPNNICVSLSSFISHSVSLSLSLIFSLSLFSLLPMGSFSFRIVFISIDAICTAVVPQVSSRAKQIHISRIYQLPQQSIPNISTMTRSKQCVCGIKRQEFQKQLFRRIFHIFFVCNICIVVRLAFCLIVFAFDERKFH